MLWLCLFADDPNRERQADSLQRLANWALEFTPRISLNLPGSVLLEIGGSLHYFRGLEALRQRVQKGLEKLGIPIHTGIAPTPTAAWLIARAGGDTPIIHRRDLPEGLAPLPLGVLSVEQRQAKALQGLGCRTIGELRRLPVAGLTRRIGRHVVETLQKAHGERPDPQPEWKPAQSFEAHLDFADPVTDHQQLHTPLGGLIDRLCTELRRQDAGILRVHITLTPTRGDARTLTVGVLSPSRDAEHLKALLQQRLEGQTSADGIIGAHLQSGPLRSFNNDSPPLDLLDALADDSAQNDWQTLVELLGHRLGEAQLSLVDAYPDHRPERAWRYRRPGDSSPGDEHRPDHPPRPGWLLETPLSLDTRQGQPHYHGALVLESPAERIESGWWDGEDVARDYYIARNPRGQRLWVYRDRRGGRRWYLHGLFA